MSTSEDGRTLTSNATSPFGSPLKERFVTGSVYSIVAVIVGKALGLVTSIIYARLLGAEDLGVFLIYLQIAGLGLALGGLSWGNAITKFVAQLRAEDRSKLSESLSTVVEVTLVSAMIASVAIFVLAEAVGRGVYRSDTLAVMIQLFSAFLVLNVLTSVGSSILQGFQSIRKLSLVGISLEALGIPVAVVSLLAFGLVGAAIGGVITAAVGAAMTFGSAASTWRREGIRLRFAFNRGAARTHLLYSAPLLVSTIALRTVLLYQSSFLALLLGFGDAGLFKVASTLYGVVLLVPSAISVPLLPVASELYATASPLRAKESLTKLIRIISLLGAPVALTVGLAAAPLIELFFGSQFRNAAPLVFVLAIAGFMEIIGRVGSNTVLGEGRTSLLLQIDLVYALAIVVATTFFVGWLGLMGIGFAVLATTSLYSSILIAKLSVDGRICLASLSRSFLLATGGFLLATLGVVFGNAQGNLWFGGAIVTAYAVTATVFMDPADRAELNGIVRAMYRGLLR